MAAVAALFVSFGFWISERFIEEATLDKALVTELDRFIDSGESSPPPSALYPQLRLYRLPETRYRSAPAELSTLPPGMYVGQDEIGREKITVVRAIDSAEKAVLIYIDEQAPSRRRDLAIAIVVGVILTGGISVWMSRRLALETLAPLDSLVENLARLNPEIRGERLAKSKADSELSIITDAMNSYMSRLDEVVSRERAFNVASSHELRTPLAIIKSSAEVLADSGHTSHHITRISRAADTAARHLDALLLLSSKGIEPVETFRLDERLVSLCADQIDVDRIQWHLAPCVVKTSPGALAIVVSNLLRNAVKASPLPGTVNVHVHAGHLTVDDDGPGLSAAIARTMFDLGTSSDGGSGMGLYMAQALSKRYGWDLTIGNKEEGGVRARLEF